MTHETGTTHSGHPERTDGLGRRAFVTRVGGLAAQAELKEAAAESGAARRPRRPRRPRTNADQADSGSGDANAGDMAAAPADSGNAEPVIADIDN